VKRTTGITLSIVTALLLAMPLCAQTTPMKAEEKKPPTVGELPLPADSIIVLCEKAADLLRALPNAVILPPARYQELIDEIERLKRLVEAQKAVSITKCAMTGKVDGKRVELQLKFSFVTERDKAIVLLGCSQAQPTSVTLDGKSPAAWNGTDGLSIQVDKKGSHEAELTVELPVTPRALSPLEKVPDTGTPTSSTVGFELDLPLCAITTLSLEVPANGKDFKINDVLLQEPLILKDNQLTGPLNRPTRLKITWRKPPVVQSEASVLVADGKITVGLQPKKMSVSAELTLKTLGAPTKQWKLIVPATAEVKLANVADESRLLRPIQGNGGGSTSRTIDLKEASSDPLVVVVEMHQSGGAPMLLGPFVVQGASRQRGTILVSAPNDQRIRHRLPAKKQNDSSPLVETGSRTATDDERKQSSAVLLALSYWNLTGGEKGDERAPWLELEQEPIQGVLATRLLHTLRVTPAAPTTGSRWEWRLTSTVDGLPVRNGVEVMNFLWPKPWRMDEERGPRPVDWTHPYQSTPQGENVLSRFELPRDSLKPFQLILESLPYRVGEADENGSDVQTAMLALPRTQTGRDRGNHVITIVGNDEIDLSIAQPLNPTLELVTQEVGKVVWRSERMPAQLAVAWKPYRAEFAISSTIDVHLDGQRGTFEQRLRLLKPGTAPRQIVLRVPESIADRLELLRGGQLYSSVKVPGSLYRVMRVDRGTNGDNGEIVVSAGFPLAPNGADTAIPVAVPQQATQGHITARVWGEPGSRVALSGNDTWQPAALESVPDQDRWPILVARTARPDVPLALRYERPSSGLGRLVVDRALVQVQALDGGAQRYRIRLLLREPSGQPLEIQFPAPLATLDLQLFLDGKRLDSWEGVDETGKVVGDSGRTARVRLAESRKSSILEITYQLVPGRTGGSGQLSSVLQPASVPAIAAGVPTRWQIELPEDWVALPVDGGGSWTWGWRGWLLAPRPALDNRELERWLAGEEAAEQLSSEYADSSCSLVSWRTDLTNVTVYHIPQAACLLVCSVFVLALGLILVTGLTGPSRSRSDPGSIPLRIWILLGLSIVTLILLGIFLPGLLAVLIFGSQPGLLVLIVVVLIQWIVHERQRRRLVYLPGFSRRAPGSSLLQGRSTRSSKPGLNGSPSSQQQPPLAEQPQASTVDVPAPPGLGAN